VVYTSSETRIILAPSKEEHMKQIVTWNIRT